MPLASARMVGQYIRLMRFPCLRLSLFAAVIALVSAAAAPAQTIRTRPDGLLDVDAPAGATVRYTLDGSEPDKSAGIWLAPVDLPSGYTLKARAFAADGTPVGNVVVKAAAAAASRKPSTLVPLTQNRDWRTYDWVARHAACVKLMQERQPEIVMLGDSITHFWGGEPVGGRRTAAEEWDRFFAGRRVVNLGYGWDRTENVLWRLTHGEFEHVSPKVVVLMIGTNNIDVNTPDEIAAGVGAVSLEIHRRSPSTRILLLSIFPRGEKPSDPARAKVAAVNQRIAALDGKEGVTYLDIGSTFLEPDGSISETVMYDFLHPSALGYARWTAAMKPTLDRLLAADAAVPPRAGTSPDLGQRINDFVAEEMAKQHVPGVAVAVVQHGTVLKARGYGFANLELRVPATAATIFESGSLGKQFTATAVMLQVEDGKLALSDPITKFFPGAPDTWRRITVRNLLTHTSGIPDYTENSVDLQKNYSEDQLATVAFGLPLEFPPGSRWNYSNTGYVLLGIIVHKVAGAFYGDVLSERVFKPLGMTTTRVISEEDIVANRADGYEWHDGQIKNQGWVSPTLNTTADGSLYFTVNDLIAWDHAVETRAILKPESWHEILTPVQLTSGKTYPYGFGWSLDERDGKPLQEHSGAWQGFKTQFSRFIGDDLSVIVLANLAQARPERFADGIAAIVDPALAVPALSPIEDREPQVTAKLAALLETARQGALTPADFAYMRAGFFPDGATAVHERLEALGPAGTLVLERREERGDNRIYTYAVPFGARVMRYSVGLAPDGRISQFGLAEKP